MGIPTPNTSLSQRRAGQQVLDTAVHDVAGAETTGSARQRVDLAANRSFASSVEDVHLAEAMMHLQIQEVAYQATLQTMARTLPPSLARFLR